jgi:hypothetical protein
LDRTLDGGWFRFSLEKDADGSRVQLYAKRGQALTDGDITEIVSLLDQQMSRGQLLIETLTEWRDDPYVNRATKLQIDVLLSRTREVIRGAAQIWELLDITDIRDDG